MRSIYGDCALRYSDSSDHFLPQGLNSVQKLKFENVDPSAVLCINNCGSDCGTPRPSMSSQINSVWDFDGSISGTGIPSIVGTNSDWWNVDNTCVKNPYDKIWSCPWQWTDWGVSSNGAATRDRTIGYIEPIVTGLSSGCDSAKFGVTACLNPHLAPYTVGR